MLPQKFHFRGQLKECRKLRATDDTVAAAATALLQMQPTEEDPARNKWTKKLRHELSSILSKNRQNLKERGTAVDGKLFSFGIEKFWRPNVLHSRAVVRFSNLRG